MEKGFQQLPRPQLGKFPFQDGSLFPGLYQEGGQDGCFGFIMLSQHGGPQHDEPIVLLLNLDFLQTFRLVQACAPRSVFFFGAAGM